MAAVRNADILVLASRIGMYIGRYVYICMYLGYILGIYVDDAE